MGPLPPIGDLSAAELIQAMRRDKKVVAGKLHFVLPTGIGSTRVVTDVTCRGAHGGVDGDRSSRLTGAVSRIRCSLSLAISIL